MPEYEFQRGPSHFVVRCNVRDIETLTALFAVEGWSRVYDAPAVVVVPGFADAMEESTGAADAQERDAAEGRREGLELIRRGLLEEGIA